MRKNDSFDEKTFIEKAVFVAELGDTRSLKLYIHKFPSKLTDFKKEHPLFPYDKICDTIFNEYLDYFNNSLDPKCDNYQHQTSFLHEKYFEKIFDFFDIMLENEIQISKKTTLNFFKYIKQNSMYITWNSLHRTSNIKEFIDRINAVYKKLLPNIDLQMLKEGQQHLIEIYQTWINCLKERIYKEDKFRYVFIKQCEEAEELLIEFERSILK